GAAMHVTHRMGSPKTSIEEQVRQETNFDGKFERSVGVIHIRCGFDECLHLKRRVGRRTMPILLARSSVKVMPAANAADRSSRNLGAARPVASRPRCPETVSRSHQGPTPMVLPRGAARPAAKASSLDRRRC